MQPPTIFLLALVLSFVAAPVLSNGCPAPKQFCSRCPRKDNAGHTLQDEIEGAVFIQCQYQDTNCFYGPKFDGPPTLPLSASFPAGACPNRLGESICSCPIPPPKPKFISTKCPDFNVDIIHVPLRGQPANSAFTQCHYASSECYYDGAGNLATPPSIPIPNPPTTPVGGACPPRLVDEHAQFVS